MQYKQLDKQYMDDVIASAMYEREREHFHYQLNLDNYLFLLPTLPSGRQDGTAQERADFEHRKRIEGLVETEKVARDQIESYYSALEAKASVDPTAHAEAIQRVSAKRAVASAQAEAEAIVAVKK